MVSSSRFVGAASGRLSAGTEPRYGTLMPNRGGAVEAWGYAIGPGGGRSAVRGAADRARRADLGAGPPRSRPWRDRPGHRWCGHRQEPAGGDRARRGDLNGGGGDRQTGRWHTGRDADRVRRVPSRPADAAALAGVPCRRVSLPLGGRRSAARRGAAAARRPGPTSWRCCGRRPAPPTAAAARRSARAGTASRCSATSWTTSSRRRGRHRSCWSSRTCTGRTRRPWRCFGCSLRSWPGARSSSSRPRVPPPMTTTRRRSPG